MTSVWCWEELSWKTIVLQWVHCRNNPWLHTSRVSLLYINVVVILTNLRLPSFLALIAIRRVTRNSVHKNVCMFVEWSIPILKCYVYIFEICGTYLQKRLAFSYTIHYTLYTPTSCIVWSRTEFRQLWMQRELGIFPLIKCWYCFCLLLYTRKNFPGYANTVIYK